MDDKTLNSLRQITPESPSKDTREKALNAAMQAYDQAEKKKTSKNSQGFFGVGRLISDLNQQIGSLLMKKQLVTGTTLAVLVAVIVAPMVMKKEDVGVMNGNGASMNGIVTEEDKASSADFANTPAMPAVSMKKASRNQAVEEVMTQSAKIAPSYATAPPPAMPAPSIMAASPAMIGGRGGVAPQDSIMPPAEYEGRDQFEDTSPNPLKKVSEEPVSTFSVDVDTASYALMRRALNNGRLPEKDAVRVEELINYFDYEYPLPASKEQPFKPTVAVYPTPWNPHTKLLHIGIKGHDIVPAEKPRSNLVFLLDVSGSMNSPDKLPLLKNAFRMMVENMEAEDTVSIVTYAGNAGTVLEPTKVAEKQKILSALDHLQAGGATAGAQGIEQAYALAEQSFDKNGVNRVLLATDGDFNVGITNRETLKDYIERKRDSGIFLSVLGFGRGNYNDALMQKLAQNGNGNAAYIDTLSEARKVLVEEASSTLYPIAKDVKIQIEFNPQSVSEYRLIGYETRMLKREDFNNDKVDAGDIGSGHTVTAIYEMTPVGSKAQMIDDLRYQNAEVKPVRQAAGGSEYAFLKLRYKLPKEQTSKLIELPIDAALEADSIAQTSADIRFAASVAAFGQLMRGESQLGDFTYDDVIALAKDARGEDEFGYRSEFLNLVRLAKSARAM